MKTNVSICGVTSRCLKYPTFSGRIRAEKDISAEHRVIGNL